MCNFFSLVSDGKGNVFYFDGMHRKQIRDGKLNFEPDSHTSIATHFGFEGAKEDKLNKYEYNPLTKKFVVDQQNTNDDRSAVESFCNKLDFKTIVPELNLHPMMNVLQVKRKNKGPTKAEIKLLKQWASVWDSVGASMWAYSSSFFILPEWKYCEKVKYKKGTNPFQPCIDLWNAGLIPNFDGTIWRLHTGPKADIVYTWTPKKAGAK